MAATWASEMFTKVLKLGYVACINYNHQAEVINRI